jgi:hypothetical protein
MPKASRSAEALIPNPKDRLFDQCREVLSFHHSALRTEEACGFDVT